MKKVTTILAAVLAIAALAIVAVSCDGTTPDPDDNGLGDGRKISRLTQVGNPNALDEFDRHDRVYDFEYDAQNRLVSLTLPYYQQADDPRLRFVYADDRVTVTFPIGATSDVICDTEGNCEGGETHFGTATIEAQLNAGGYIASGIFTTVWDNVPHNDESGTMSATYDANGYLTGLALNEGQSNVNHLSLTWTGGNLTRVQESPTHYAVAQYTSSPNKANLDLNWLVYSASFYSLDGFSMCAIAGLLGQRNQNLVAQTDEHYDEHIMKEAYSYVFDSEGYVTQWTTTPLDRPSSVPMTYKVEYRQ
ncbi:MAG: DUF4595 domain-containing protein [Prevotellaceae bacterium]|jgi:hypothetical protein|nr:DUF4595 domain-containing protein [Prevotellaceae bacterium]